MGPSQLNIEWVKTMLFLNILMDKYYMSSATDVLMHQYVDSSPLDEFMQFYL